MRARWQGRRIWLFVAGRLVLGAIAAAVVIGLGELALQIFADNDSLFESWPRRLLALGGAIAIVGFIGLAPPDRHSAATSGIVGGLLQLVATWLLAILATTALYDVTDEQGVRSKAMPWLLLVPFLGGLFALIRSAQTRADTAAALGEIARLRVASLSAPLVQAAVEVLATSALPDALERIQRMLRLVASSPLTDARVNRATLWSRASTGTWHIVAATHPRPADPVFTQAMTGARRQGVLANLDANRASGDERTWKKPAAAWTRDDVFLCAAGCHAHAWYKPRDDDDRETEGMAAVLLRHPRDGSVIGALALTSLHQDVVPVTDPLRGEWVDILSQWAHAFVKAIEHLATCSSGASDEQPQES